jgi:hypothetical protein
MCLVTGVPERIILETAESSGDRAVLAVPLLDYTMQQRLMASAFMNGGIMQHSGDCLRTS